MLECCALGILVILFTIVTKDFQEYKDPEEIEEESKSKTRLLSEGEPDEVTLPLGENVLVNNLGIPIIIVVTKVCIEY